MSNILTINKNLIHALCIKHKVRKLYAFGSVLTNRFHANSDIDLAVNFYDSEVEDSFVNFFDFQEALEGVFKRKVDLVDYNFISNKTFRQELDRTCQLIYG